MQALSVPCSAALAMNSSGLLVPTMLRHAHFIDYVAMMSICCLTGTEVCYPVMRSLLCNKQHAIPISVPSLQTSRSGVISDDAAQEAASSSEVRPDASLAPEANTAEESVSGNCNHMHMIHSGSPHVYGFACHPYRHACASLVDCKLSRLQAQSTCAMPVKA